ncbi:hypothetical protein MSAN_01930900 [Mycena sanguinolenta]|uniref:F-box domain-containing protein n=1 Tax=Mycena sanguinolenta TaxID=230812 RepID=A0A8H6XPZ8_9AGAR|nr:hypothetical protein MSAN_01930900 [Mycena sanguinolenta]
MLLSNSSLPVFPPELVDAIICEIDDLESLKACSLVALSWRSRSQRILFDTLTVTVENYAALFKLLTESPHIASYITHLILRMMYAAMPVRDIESIPQILDKLHNVRRCMLAGLQSRMHTVPVSVNSQIAFPPLVLDFLVRQQLRELSFICIHIPASALWYLLTTVPKLSFQESVVLPDIGAAETVVHTPVLRSLVLNSTKDIGQYVVRPQNMRCLAALRHLSLRSTDDEWAGQLIEAICGTLEHIHLYFADSKHPPRNLPQLPALRTLQLTFSSEVFVTASTIVIVNPEVISRTADILSSFIFPEMLPALAEVKIEQLSVGDIVFNPAPLLLPLSAVLDAALVAYLTPPSIHWFLDMNDKGIIFARFADTVRRGMPRAYTTGRLVMKTYAASKTPHFYIS